MARFFVSYSGSTKSMVSEIVTLLRASGHDVWWDSDIPIIADWWATILTKIEWCEVFIFVVSSQSIKSAFCLKELEYATNRQRPVLPFMLEVPDRATLPSALPARGQWLIYNGNPAQMLTQINTACRNINWAHHRDIKVSRPPEPLTGSESLAKQFHTARRLANDKKFDDAKAAFGNIKRLDYDEWGSECDEWLGRLNGYESVMELIDDESTLSRARTAWVMHKRQYGKDFDPHGIEVKLRRASTFEQRRRLWHFAIVGVVVFGLVFMGLIVMSFVESTRNIVSTDAVNSSVQSEIPTPVQQFHLLPLEDAIFWDEDGTLGLVVSGGGLEHREFLNIPFEIGRGISTFGCGDGVTDRVELIADVFNPLSLHFLIQAGNASSRYEGLKLGSIQIFFSDGRSLNEDLIVGYNIRDWSRNFPNSVTTVTSANTLEAWRGFAPSGREGGIDMLTIPISETYLGTSLTNVEVLDTSDDAEISNNLCIHLTAVTVEVSL